MIDIHELRELMMDLECMTALRHVLKNPAIDALCSLLSNMMDNAIEACLRVPEGAGTGGSLWRFSSPRNNNR